MNYFKTPLNFKFEDWPQKLEKEDYQGVLDLTVTDLKKNKDVAAIYSMGQNWLLGLSDLDVIVVYKNGVSEIHLQKPNSLSKKSKYLFTHDYLHLNLDSFRNIYYIHPKKMNLCLLYGEDIPCADPEKELSEEEFNFLKASLAMDFLITKLLLLPQYFFYNIVSARKMLLFLNSFVYTIEMVEEITERKIKTDFPEEIKSLRNNWFLNRKEKNAEALNSAIRDGFKAAIEILRELDIFFKASFNLGKLPKGLVFNPPDFYIAGTEKWEEKEFLDGFLDGYVKIKNPLSKKMLKNYKLLVPNSFFLLFSLYTRERGPYSDWFKRFLKCPFFFSVAGERGVFRRMGVLNKIPIKKNGRALFTLPFLYGFHTTNYWKESLKVKAVSLVRFLKRA